MPAENIRWHDGGVAAAEREALLGQRGGVVWFTGLSGSGKSTVANAVNRRLVAEGRLSYLLDGDNLRHGLCGDLGFDEASREENVRRVAHVAQLFADLGAITLVAFISPYRKDRDQARHLIAEGRFFEIHVATPLEACEERDPKGLYAKARRGEISSFTGLSAPYEAPDAPELSIDTSALTIDEAADAVLAAIEPLRAPAQAP